MHCWNCGKKISDKAKVCQFCETPVQAEPTADEEEAVWELLQQMAPKAMEELQAAFADSSTAEEFVNRIMVGPCPKCDSTETGHCENDPEIGELLVGRCFRCGQLWCTECGQLLKPDAPLCECWSEDDSDP
jgi:hypothetical protein